MADGKQKALNHAWWASCGAMFASAFLLATWIVRIPDVATSLTLDDGQVGTAIFGLAIGAFAAFAAASRILEHRDSRLLILIFGLINAVGLALLALSWSFTSLFLLLMLFGFGHGGLNVAMNALAIEVDAGFERYWMGVFQGCFSLGGLTGAICGSLIIWLEIPFHTQFVVTALCAPIPFVLIYKFAIPDVRDDRAAAEPRPILALPPKAILGLGIIALCSSVGEGAMADWSGLYREQELHVTDASTAFGYAAFSLFMLVGRFSSAQILQYVAPETLVRSAGLVAAIGLAVGLIINDSVSVIVGFGLVGLGLSVMIPIAYSAITNHPEIPRGRAIASVVTLGYSGVVFGPPILGWLAELTSLRLALFVVVGTSLAIALMAPNVAARRS
ncbi:MAG: MFS transporter [Pseudomonadota bacterium]